VDARWQGEQPSGLEAWLAQQSLGEYFPLLVAEGYDDVAELQVSAVCRWRFLAEISLRF
jgi:hypothetical protein